MVLGMKDLRFLVLSLVLPEGAIFSSLVARPSWADDRKQTADNSRYQTQDIRHQTPLVVPKAAM